MKQILLEHLTSAFQTFIATFLTVAGSTLATGGIQWTYAFWGAVLLTAVRAAVKEVLAHYAPPVLGGRGN